MKKAFLLAITVFLLLSSFSSTVYALSGDDIIGTWRLTSVVIDSKILTPEEAGMLFISLNAENNAVILSPGNDQQFMNWNITGDSVVLKNDSDEVICIYEDGNLMFEDNGIIMTFERVSDEIEIVADSPVKNSVVIDDFIGMWSGVYIEASGFFITLTDAGVEVTLIITENTLESRERYGDMEVVNTATCTMAGYYLQINNSDGTTQLLALHENGMIALPSYGTTIWLTNDNGTVDIPPDELWKCAACGRVENMEMFCADCGAMKPQLTEPDGWNCSCGAENKGKFCTKCGRSKPGNTPQPIYLCGNCGWEPEGLENPPDYCAECGALMLIDGQWRCAICEHKENKDNFCTECGQPKPDVKNEYMCSDCGWEPEDLENPPKYCPKCGDIFNEDDLLVPCRWCSGKLRCIHQILGNWKHSS